MSVKSCVPFFYVLTQYWILIEKSDPEWFDSVSDLIESSFTRPDDGMLLPLKPVLHSSAAGFGLLGRGQRVKKDGSDDSLFKKSHRQNCAKNDPDKSHWNYWNASFGSLKTNFYQSQLPGTHLNAELNHLFESAIGFKIWLIFMEFSSLKAIVSNM